MRKTLTFIAVLMTATIFTGCASSRVRFEEPAGAHLYLEPSGTHRDTQEYTLPIAIDLPQTDSPAALQSNVGGRPVRLALPDGTMLKGYLYVYKLDMDQVERLAEVTFKLTDEEIAKLQSGNAVTVLGYSARKRPVYKINLGLDR